MIRLHSCAALAALALAACGDDAPGPGVFADGGPLPDARAIPDASMLPDAGEAAVPDAGLPDATVNDDGPTIEVLAPAAATGFGSDEIVTRTRVTGRCRVDPNADSGIPVDETSVRMTAVVGGRSQTVNATATPTPNVYTASFSLDDFPNGELTVRCSAADTGAPATTNSASITTYFDLGPSITVFSPLDDDSIAGSVDVLFRVTAAPVAAGDTGGAVGTVRAFIGGVEITDDLTVNADGNLEASVAFDDPAFTLPLDGPVSVVVRASNTRAPEPVTRVSEVVFVADSNGPTIAITTPAAGALVSGLITISANVTDAAGVDTASVVATVAHSFEVPLVNTGGSTYSALFDTRQLANTWVFPPIDVRAQDNVGNESAVGRLVALDNQPPIVSLDPPLIREGKLDPELGLVCSLLFDPLGFDSTNDGASVAQLSEMRVRAQDFGNGATDSSGVPLLIALVDEGSVAIYVLDDDTQALVVDTDGDGRCDSINPDITPTSVPMTSTEAFVVNLVSLGEDGNSDFNPPDVPYGGFDAACNPPPVDETPPPNLCTGVVATRLIVDDINKQPLIYGIPPAEGVQCMGNGFDAAAANLADGWACVAAIASDNLGNSNVSAPLRICVDSDLDSAEGCNVFGPPQVPPNSCTDGCTPDAFVPEVLRIDL